MRKRRCRHTAETLFKTTKGCDSVSGWCRNTPCLGLKSPASRNTHASLKVTNVQSKGAFVLLFSRDGCQIGRLRAGRRMCVNRLRRQTLYKSSRKHMEKMSFMKQAGQQKPGAASLTGLTIGPQPTMGYGMPPMGMMRQTPEQIALGMPPMGMMRPTPEQYSRNYQAMVANANTPYIANPNYIQPLPTTHREPFGFGTTKPLYNPMNPMGGMPRQDGYASHAFKYSL